MNLPRILLVDDEPSNVATLEAMLAAEPYDLHTAVDGLEAISAARRIRPDLILLDVMMPVMDGFAVCRRLREDPQLRQVPIVMITALNDDVSRLQAVEAGADDFLTKPCSREELRARVRTIVSLNRFRLISEERAQFQQLFDIAPSGIVCVDQEGRVMEANGQALQLLWPGVAEPVAGRRLVESFDGASAKRVQTALDRALSQRAPSAEDVRVALGRSKRILRVRGEGLIRDSKPCAMLLFDDVTAEVQARTQLRTSNQKLEDAVRRRTQQLAEANELLLSYAAFVSHDLRSPLTVTKGFLSLLHQRVVPIGDEAAKIVEQAYQGTLIMQQLLDNILELARAEHAGTAPGPNRCGEPERVVHRVWAHLRPMRTAEVALTVGAIPDLGVSTLLLERVCYNLLANALKFVSSVPAAAVAVTAQQVGDHIVLAVSDNGVPLDQRGADALFAEFSRLTAGVPANKIGLGLSLVAKLVRLHGGRVWAENGSTAGATYFVELPAAREREPDFKAP